MLTFYFELGWLKLSAEAHGSAFFMITGDGLRKKAFKLNIPLPAQPANCTIYLHLSHWPTLFSPSNDDAQSEPSQGNLKKKSPVSFLTVAVFVFVRGWIKKKVWLNKPHSSSFKPFELGNYFLFPWNRFSVTCYWLHKLKLVITSIWTIIQVENKITYFTGRSFGVLVNISRQYVSFFKFCYTLRFVHFVRLWCDDRAVAYGFTTDTGAQSVFPFQWLIIRTNLESKLYFLTRDTS